MSLKIRCKGTRLDARNFPDQGTRNSHYVKTFIPSKLFSSRKRIRVRSPESSETWIKSPIMCTYEEIPKHHVGTEIESPASANLAQNPIYSSRRFGGKRFVFIQQICRDEGLRIWERGSNQSVSRSESSGPGMGKLRPTPSQPGGY